MFITKSQYNNILDRLDNIELNLHNDECGDIKEEPKSRNWFPAFNFAIVSKIIGIEYNTIRRTCTISYIFGVTDCGNYNEQYQEWTCECDEDQYNKLFDDYTEYLKWR